MRRSARGRTPSASRSPIPRRSAVWVQHAGPRKRSRKGSCWQSFRHRVQPVIGHRVVGCRCTRAELDALARRSAQRFRVAFDRRVDVGPAGSDLSTGPLVRPARLTVTIQMSIPPEISALCDAVENSVAARENVSERLPPAADRARCSVMAPLCKPESRQMSEPEQGAFVRNRIDHAIAAGEHAGILIPSLAQHFAHPGRRPLECARLLQVPIPAKLTACSHSVDAAVIAGADMQQAVPPIADRLPIPPFAQLNVPSLDRCRYQKSVPLASIA